MNLKEVFNRWNNIHVERQEIVHSMTRKIQSYNAKIDFFLEKPGEFYNLATSMNISEFATRIVSLNNEGRMDHVITQIPSIMSYLRELEKDASEFCVEKPNGYEELLMRFESQTILISRTHGTYRSYYQESRFLVLFEHYICHQ